MLKASHQPEGYRGVQVAVLGATGFIGRWVARKLCQDGAKVALFVRNRAVGEPIFSGYGVQGQLFELDLLDFETMKRLFREIRPSITFNLAGYGVKLRQEQDEVIAYRINYHLVEQLCDIIADIHDPGWEGQALIHVGSMAEYGSLDRSLAEDSPARPTTLYGQSKLAGSQALAQRCQSLGLKGITARAFSVYGPGEYGERLLPLLLKTVQTGQPLPLTSGAQHRDFTYVEDVAEGLLRLGLVRVARPGEIVNLATGKLTSVRNFVEIAAEVLQISETLLEFDAIPVPAETKEWNRIEHAPVPLKRLQHLIGWLPATDIRSGIGKTANFLKAQKASAGHLAR
jgi:nucleoside-diphosphate-sugar epimerase